MYEDLMDNTRFVKPINDISGKQTTVRVYFMTNKGLTYAGRTTVPTSLFTNPRVGFVPASTHGAN